MRTNAGLVVVACCAVGLLGVYVAYSPTHTSVVTKVSPGGRHTANLWRSSSIDVNYHISVDGDDVYRSADFAPVDADFREQLYWSVDGESVVLEIADTKVFGYNVTERRELSDEELSNVRVTPFSKLRFEGKIPAPHGG